MNFISLAKRTASIFRSQPVVPVPVVVPVVVPVAVPVLSVVPAQPDVSELEKNITDEWFRSHFIFASDVVNEWLSEMIAMNQSRVLDFGCGDGIMALGLAMRHRPREVIGTDIHDAFQYLPDTAKKQLGLESMPSHIRFEQVLPGQSLQSKGPIDAAFSWSVFEHIDRQYLLPILQDIFSALPAGGVFFLQIEPLYFSPFGNHLSGLISEPWVHLLCSNEELLARIEACEPEQMHDDHKNKVFELCTFNDFKVYLKREYQSLNKLTLQELLELVEKVGFSVEKKWETHSELPVPESLLAKYSREDLTRNETRLLLRKN